MGKLIVIDEWLRDRKGILRLRGKKFEDWFLNWISRGRTPEQVKKILEETRVRRR